MTVAAFLALAAAICAVSLTPARTSPCYADQHHRLSRLPLPSLLFAIIALVLAIPAGLISFAAALLLGLLTVLALWLRLSTTISIIRSGGWLLLGLLALAGALHWLPGVHNPLLVDARQLTPDAIPYTLYANFDKGWAGYCLLLAIWPAQRLLQPAKFSWPIAFWRGIWPVWPLTVILTLGLAMGLGLLKLAPKWPDFALQFIFCNLLFTCVAEEAFFRGLLQRPLLTSLQQRGLAPTTAAWVAIGAVSLLFGLAHLAGGWAYAAVATVASIGYGWAYQRSGRIEVAIVAHFALNLLHFSALTYPMLQPAP